MKTTPGERQPGVGFDRVNGYVVPARHRTRKTCPG